MQIDKKNYKVAEFSSQNGHNGGTYIIILLASWEFPSQVEAAVSSEASQLTVLSRLARQALQDRIG